MPEGEIRWAGWIGRGAASLVMALAAFVALDGAIGAWLDPHDREYCIGCEGPFADRLFNSQPGFSLWNGAIGLAALASALSPIVLPKHLRDSSQIVFLAIVVVAVVFNGAVMQMQ